MLLQQNNCRAKVSLSLFNVIRFVQARNIREGWSTLEACTLHEVEASHSLGNDSRNVRFTGLKIHMLGFVIKKTIGQYLVWLFQEVPLSSVDQASNPEGKSHKMTWFRRERYFTNVTPTCYRKLDRPNFASFDATGMFFGVLNSSWSPAPHFLYCPPPF